MIPWSLLYIIYIHIYTNKQRESIRCMIIKVKKIFGYREYLRKNTY